MKKLLFSAACLLTGILFTASVATGQQVVRDAGDFQSPAVSAFSAPPAIQLQSIIGGLTRPTYITNARDARLFIVQQDGRILIFQNGALLPTPFLDIVSRVACCGERGLIGLAFHPNYPTTPYVFTHFTSNGAALPDGTTPALGDNVVVRFNASGNAVDVASGKTLLVIPQPFANHNGGTIEFGNDGFLYIGKGDGGSGNDPGNRAQNINLLLGKILRIDVNQNVNTPPFYGIPPTNPFVNAPGADEIFLVGLRNPFRFSFDRTNGDLWIGDVGQSAREEIDRLPINASAPGKNLGWRIFEGTFCTGLDPCVPPANYLPPVAEYSHTGGRCSITGGYVYRGTQIPELVGSYVYADFCTGEIFRLLGTTPELMLDTTHNIASFGEDSAGELYIVALSGQILKINAAPSSATAVISGRLVNSAGQGVGGVTIVLTGGNLSGQVSAFTDASGNYQFPAVEIGQTYTVTPISRTRGFSPQNRVITLSGNVTNADFYTKF